MVLNTRGKIINAFFALAMENPEKSNFSLAEIAEKAGISRQAIYKRHFNSSHEIIEYIHQEIKDEFQALYQTYDKEIYPDPFVFFVQIIIPALYKRKKWISCLYTTAADPYWRNFVRTIYRHWIEKNIVIDYKKLNVSKDKATQVLIMGMMSMVEAWISQPKPTPPKQFEKTFLNLINFSLADYVCSNKESDKLVVANSTIDSKNKS